MNDTRVKEQNNYSVESLSETCERAFNQVEKNANRAISRNYDESDSDFRKRILNQISSDAREDNERH